MIALDRTLVSLEGRKGLVTGIANDQSIAWGCAKAFRALGAELAVTYLNEKARPHVEPLARKLEAPLFLPLDVMHAGEMQAVFDGIRRSWGRSRRRSSPAAATPPPSSARKGSACTPYRPARSRRAPLPASPTSTNCS